MVSRWMLAVIVGWMLLMVGGSTAQIPTPGVPKSLPPMADPGLPAPPPIELKKDGPPLGPQFSLQPTPPMPMPPRFSFNFDAQAAPATFLPAPPKTAAKLPLWTNEDLTKVPEVAFGDPVAKDLSRIKALEATAHILAKMNHLNAKKTDGFMLALLAQRTDLRGLPFLMGEDCRTGEDQAQAFRDLTNMVNQLVISCKANSGPFGVPAAMPPGPQPAGSLRADALWQSMSSLNAGIQNGTLRASLPGLAGVSKDTAHRAMIAALMQILMPEPEYFRLGLAKFLATVPHPDATAALAKLALFSPEEPIRAAAVEGLRTRRERDYTQALLDGFRYPLPVVARRAAESLIKLERKDLLTNLIDVLERPDPRLPVTEKQDGKEVTKVRELVRVNHHRNCALCHAPGNTNVPDGVLTVAVPLPGEPLPKPSAGGYQSVTPASPDIVVRVDMTYLRQDFSLMMRESDPHPWPEMQRFDFLVRTRTLTASEAQAYESCCEPDEPGHLSPYHRAALFALRELTGRDTEPTAAGWRKLLKLSK